MLARFVRLLVERANLCQLFADWPGIEGGYPQANSYLVLVTGCCRATGLLADRTRMIHEPALRGLGLAADYFAICSDDFHAIIVRHGIVHITRLDNDEIEWE